MLCCTVWDDGGISDCCTRQVLETGMGKPVLASSCPCLYNLIWCPAWGGHEIRLKGQANLSSCHTLDLSPHQDGVVWPSQAELFLAPCSAEKQFNNSVTMWNNVFGFNFSSLSWAWFELTTVLYQYCLISQMAREELHGRPIHDHVVLLDDLLADKSMVLTMDMATISVADLEVTRGCCPHLSLCSTAVYRWMKLPLTTWLQSQVYLIMSSLSTID